MDNNISKNIINKNKGRFSKLTNSPKIDKKKPLYKKTLREKLFGKHQVSDDKLKKKIRLGVDSNFRLSLKLTIAFIILVAGIYVFTELTYSGAYISAVADDFYERGSYDRAAKYYDKAQSLDYISADLFKKMGMALIKIGNYDMAITKLSQGYELDSQDPMLVYLLAESIFLKAEKNNQLALYDQSAQYLQQAIALNPKFKDAYVLIALCYRHLGNYDLARQWYAKAIALKSFAVYEFYDLIGQSYAEQNNFAQAIVFYRQALDANPVYALSYVHLGDAYDDLNDLALALQNYQKATDISPDYTDAYIKMGDVYFERQRYEEAAQWYLAALRINPTSINANHALGLTYKNLNRDDEAVEYFRKAVYYGKDDAMDEMKSMGVDLLNVLQ
ncbi:MAG: tetratricopeptide repeat protein [Elusimicrobiota bacterium]|jgi:tetratricopeptide (TPR) repeat protein|nr:tetratricopeptide repeat protein [Elusimicrobiota bacterium]